ncbi:MAG TPA: thioester domain-containing protein [Candidatus Nocardiopsis merdipullorum]|nr:thioester domain-containing protein [Candidatus Nocardiopsis merdipullorum]
MTDISLPRTAGRVGFAAGAAALLAFGLAAPGAAGTTRAQYVDNYESGPTVHMSGGSIGTTIFNLDVEDSDSVLKTYCIDFETSIRGGAWYLEDDWANYPGKGDFAEPGKVHWILQNSYPNVGAEELGAEVGIDNLDSRDALGATQAAIWHFSNDEVLEERGNNNDLKEVYTYLVNNAEDLSQEEPEPSLRITPEEASGNAGEVVGEFLVETNAADIEVDLDAPDGVELVDVESGESVDTIGDGDTVGFSVPEGAEAGEASFSLTGSATARTGRLFKGESDEPTQTLVTAEDSPVSVSADASASWAEVDEPEPEEPEEPEVPEEPEQPEEPEESDEPEEGDEKPTPEDDDESLPVTGGALVGLVAAGVAALGAGGGALYMTRKRKASALDSDEG